MCGVFYVDDDTMREIGKIARKIDRKKAATGDVHPSQPALILQTYVRYAVNGELITVTSVTFIYLKPPSFGTTLRQ